MNLNYLKHFIVFGRTATEIEGILITFEDGYQMIAQKHELKHNEETIGKNRDRKITMLMG